MKRNRLRHRRRRRRLRRCVRERARVGERRDEEEGEKSPRLIIFNPLGRLAREDGMAALVGKCKIIRICPSFYIFTARGTLRNVSQPFCVQNPSLRNPPPSLPCLRSVSPGAKSKKYEKWLLAPARPRLDTPAIIRLECVNRANACGWDGK